MSKTTETAAIPVTPASDGTAGPMVHWDDSKMVTHFANGRALDACASLLWLPNMPALTGKGRPCSFGGREQRAYVCLRPAPPSVAISTKYMAGNTKTVSLLSSFGWP